MKNKGCCNYNFTPEMLRRMGYRPPEKVLIDSLELAIRIAKLEGVKWNYIKTTPYGVKLFVYISRTAKCGVTNERMHYTVAYWHPKKQEFHVNNQTAKNIKGDNKNG